MRKRGYRKTKFACVRCRRRKQRCDSDGPGRVCSECVKSNSQCEFDLTENENHKIQLHLNASLKQLRERNALLEAQIQSLMNHNVRPAEFLNDETEPYNEETVTTKDPLEQLADILAIEPAMTLTNTFSLIFTGVLGESLPVNNPHSVVATFRCSEILNLTQKESRDIGQQYVNRMHWRFPFLDASYIFSLIDRRESVLSGNWSRQSLVDKFVLTMVHAIGFRMNQWQVSANTSAHSTYGEAMKLVPYIMRETDLNTVQCLTLIVVYLLRSPSEIDIWRVIGHVMRLCIELRYHRRESDKLSPENAYLFVMKRRVFWTVYSLDRVISLSLARPFSLYDSDIDVDLPFNVDEAISDSGSLYEIIAEKEGASSLSEHLTSVTMSIEIIRLNRIDSRTHTLIYRVDKPLNVDDCGIKDLLQMIKERQQFVANLPAGLKRDYLEFLIHKSTRTLLAPIIYYGNAGDTLYLEQCKNSCFRVCELSKKLLQNKGYAHSLFAMNTVFLSGLTIIYCLVEGFLSWGIDISVCLNSCSTILFVLAERAPWTKTHFSDEFEQYYATAIDKLKQGFNSPADHPSEETEIAALPLDPDHQHKASIREIFQEENRHFNQLWSEICSLGIIKGDIMEMDFDAVGLN